MATTTTEKNSCVRVSFITPATASFWLSNSADFQRPISERTVKRYAAMMQNQQWKLTPSQAIAITQDNRIVDGQHRLMAVALSNQTVEMAIHYDADPDVFNVLDRGRLRSLQQIARMAGCTYHGTSHVAAVNSLLWNITPSSMLIKWTASDLPHVLSAYEDGLDVAFPRRIGGSKTLAIAPIRGAALRAYLSDPSRGPEISKFIRVMSVGWPEPTDGDMQMALMVRTIANDAVGETNRKDRHRMWLITLRALYHYLRGSTISARSLRRTDRDYKHQPFPIPLDAKPKYQSFQAWHTGKDTD